MNPKTVVILLIVLALAVVILFAPQFMSPGGGPRYDASQDVPIVPDDFLSSTLTRISFPTDSGSIELERINGRWWVTAPHLFPARTQKINEFLQRISNVSVTPPGEAVEDIVPYKQSPVYLANSEESYFLRPLKQMGAGRTQIELGTGDTIIRYNANNKFHKLLNSLIPSAYFDSSPEPLLLPELSKIEITTDGKTSTLQQSKDKWWVGAPSRNEPALEQGLSDAPGVATYVELHNSLKLAELQSYPFTEAGLSRFGLDRPLIRADFVMQGGKTFRLQVGVPADPEDKTRFVSYGPSNSAYPAVFSTDTNIAIAFGQEAIAFRDPRIIATPSTLIASIGLTFSGDLHQTIELFSDTPPTLLQGNDQRSELSADRASVMLKNLTDARAAAYLPIQLTEWDKLVSAVVTPKLGGEAEFFAIYADPQTQTDGPTVLVHRGMEPVALRVARDAVAAIIDPSLLLSAER